MIESVCSYCNGGADRADCNQCGGRGVVRTYFKKGQTVTLKFVGDVVIAEVFEWTIQATNGKKYNIGMDFVRFVAM